MANYGTVESTQRLSPSMMRVVFGGPGLDDFAATDRTDQYVNALFIPDDAPYGVPFEVHEARAAEPEHRPRGRRYTVRDWDDSSRRLTIDFVVHGDVGYAGRWAQHAQPGDRLQMIGPSGGYRPNAEADWFLFVGDESALPGIAASMRAVPTGKPCVVRLVVDGPDHEHDPASMPTDADLDLAWLHRRSSPSPEQLMVESVRALDWPDGRVDVFVHGEAGEVRALRRHLVADRGVDPAAASISPYWRRDHTDEAWRAIKKQWIADQANDV
ncbi:MAG: siderophore-interacting protein [Actinomycetota bacterium]